MPTDSTLSRNEPTKNDFERWMDATRPWWREWSREAAAACSQAQIAEMMCEAWNAGANTAESVAQRLTNCSGPAGNVGQRLTNSLPSESGRRLTKGWRFEASDVTKDHPGRLTKFWGRIYDEQGRFVSHISEDAANELLNAAPQVAPMATRGVPGSSPGASIPAEAAPSDKPSASETPIRDAWHRPLGFDGLVRARFNQFLDDVIAPMERELARLRSAGVAIKVETGMSGGTHAVWLAGKFLWGFDNGHQQHALAAGLRECLEQHNVEAALSARSAIADSDKPLLRAVRRLCEQIRKGNLEDDHGHDFTLNAEFIAVEALVGASPRSSERTSKGCDVSDRTTEKT